MIEVVTGVLFFALLRWTICLALGRNELEKDLKETNAELE